MAKIAKKNETLNRLLREKIETMKADGKASHCNYQSVLTNIEDFFGVVKMRDVNSDFIKKFKARLENNGISQSTIGMYFTLIRSIFNYAVYIGAASMDNYPFQRKSYELDKVKIPKIAKRNEWYLTREELTKLYNYFMAMKPKNRIENTKMMYIGLFLCSYLCNGANVIDLIQLKYDRKWEKSDRKCLYFRRHKVEDRSDEIITIPLTYALQNVLEKIGSCAEIGNNVLPDFFIDRELNTIDDLRSSTARLTTGCKQSLKKLSTKLIGQPISMTYARHSYSTVLHNLGAPHHIIERNLGHACNDIAFNYIGATPTKKLFEINNLLLDL